MSMSKHKYIDKICIVATILSLVLAVFFLCKGFFGLEKYVQMIGYENRLFDETKVHTIDIVMEDWNSFIESCQSEEYQVCEVVVDGESYKNVAIRGKGNTSLSNVASMGSERYSFKVEFDRYDDAKTYYGLDKLSLNNIIQDNTYMKDYLTYQMMDEFGVDAPLCSFVYITVNGEDWGLYLAVEGVEDSFLRRNYGSDYGELYKPDSMSFGGGRGNGKDFDFDAVGGNGMFAGNDDVKLQYIDDNPDSYSNIFDNAKTDISKADEKRLINSLQILNSAEEIERVVDVDEVLRYFVVHNFVCNGDSYTGSMIHNYYLYEKDGQMSMIPWDYNLAYGTFMGSDATDEVNSPIDTYKGDRPMVDWIFSDENYTELYHQYFEEFLATVDFVSIIEDAGALIEKYVEKDPTKFCTYEEFLMGVETLKTFCELRKESVEGQLDGVIPSTSTGQKEDDSMMIDASAVNVSDMGTMGDSRGGFGGSFPGGPEGFGGRRPEEQGEAMPENFDVSEMPEKFDVSDIPDDFDMSQFENSIMQEVPTNNGTDIMLGDGISDFILLGVSAIVLVIGMVVAWKFKGKNE